MKKMLFILGIFSFILTPNAFAGTIFTDISSAIGGSRVAAMGDVNGDGWVDLLGCGGILLNRGEIVDGKPTFQCVTEGLDFKGKGLSHPVFADMDGDGDQDLIASLAHGDGVLYRNDSCGDELRFVDITEQAGLGGNIGHQQTHIALSDIDMDGDLDAYLVEGWPYGNGGVLYRNDTDDTGIHFTNVTAQSGIVAPFACRTILFNDFDGDGDADLYMGSARYGATNKFYLNMGDIDGDGVTNFKDVTSVSGLQNYYLDNSATSGDIDNDGDIDILQAQHSGARTIIVYENLGDMDGNGIVNFKNVSNSSGIARTSAHGVGLGDIDNDGDLDIADASWLHPVKIYSNDGDGTFTNITSLSGIGNFIYGVRTLFADIDNDGDLDLFMKKLYMNNTNDENYLKVVLLGEGLNRDAVGAQLRAWPSGAARTIDNLVAFREVTAGTAFFSSDDYILELGLAEGLYDLEATFVSGAVTILEGVQTGKTVQIPEGPNVFFPYKCGGAPPTADAGNDRTVECAGPDGTQVTLDGSGSTDPDGDELTYNWTWDGGSAEGVSPSVTLPYGTTTVFLTVSDGEFEDSDEVNIAIEDTTPPSTSAILEGELGNNGWYVSDVDVELTAADSCTGVRDVHYTITGPGHNGSETVVEDSRANFTLNADGSYTVTYWAVDNAGNVEVIESGNVEGVDREYNPPAVTPVLPPEPPSGYYRSCVNVRLETTDSASGGAATEYWDPATQEWKPYDDTVGIPVCSTTTVKYRSTSPAGNVHYNTVVINIDQTPPTITAAVEPPANANGWNNTDVTVTFTCDDATSGVAECSAPVIVTTEGAGQVVTGTAVDKAGNTATTSVTLNIDKTAPVADISVTPGILWPPNHKTVDVAVNGGASDPSSGIASVEFTVTDDYGTVEPPVSGFNTTISLEAWRNGGDKDGRHYTITAVITDSAGNRTTVTTEAVCPHDMRGKK